ncbi:hypothetical protein GCM10010452_14220 [Crossiella cryophila]
MANIGSASRWSGRASCWWGRGGGRACRRDGAASVSAAIDPTQLNLRQVHPSPVELFEELAGEEFSVAASEMGENLTARGWTRWGCRGEAVLRLGGEGLAGGDGGLWCWWGGFELLGGYDLLDAPDW